jgi:Family of unknown function (DUF5754)
MFFIYVPYMVTRVVVRRSPRPEKKWRATFYPEKNGGVTRSVDFGLRGFSDYTIHKDHARMIRYLGRHRRRENWTPSGRYTPGFWSRWLLWSKPSLRAAQKATQKVLGPGYKLTFTSSS